MANLQHIACILSLLINAYESTLSSNELDLIMLLDSSGSVYDDGYENWQYQIDFAKSLVNNSLPINTRLSVINYSGCTVLTSFEDCVAQNKLKKMWGLSDYGSNNLFTYYNLLSNIGPSDFNGGYAWHEQAFSIAKTEFETNNTTKRNQVILFIVDGPPTPANNGHELCDKNTGYISPTLASLQELHVKILTIFVDDYTKRNSTEAQSIITRYLECLYSPTSHLNDFDKYFWYASTWAFLPFLRVAIRNEINSNKIDLVINEVMIYPNIIFVELYNRGIDVNYTGLRFEGLINYQIAETLPWNTEIEHGEYWVISTYDLWSVNQTLCSNGCSQNFLISPIDNVDMNMNNTYWNLKIYYNNSLIDAVETDETFFQTIDDLHTNQLVDEYYYNELGSNWKESCHPYGTPRHSNQITCLCDVKRCRKYKDFSAYCGFDETCVCSSGFVSSNGVCLPTRTINCCTLSIKECIGYKFNNTLRWCAVKGIIQSYRIYKNDVFLTTVDSPITELMIYDLQCGVDSFKITAVYQTVPLIESESTDCESSWTFFPTAIPSNLPSISPVQMTTDLPSSSPSELVTQTETTYTTITSEEPSKSPLLPVQPEHAPNVKINFQLFFVLFVGVFVCV